ncbi:unnamed protein product, partial [Prorocentrum cordatum]
NETSEDSNADGAATRACCQRKANIEPVIPTPIRSSGVRACEKREAKIEPQEYCYKAVAAGSGASLREQAVAGSGASSGASLREQAVAGSGASSGESLREQAATGSGASSGSAAGGGQWCEQWAVAGSGGQWCGTSRPAVAYPTAALLRAAAAEAARAARARRNNNHKQHQKAPDYQKEDSGDQKEDPDNQKEDPGDQRDPDERAAVQAGSGATRQRWCERAGSGASGQWCARTGSGGQKDARAGSGASGQWCERAVVRAVVDSEQAAAGSGASLREQAAAGSGARSGARQREQAAAGSGASSGSLLREQAATGSGASSGSGQCSTNIWESGQIPSNIRKPWDIFEEDLEDTLNDVIDRTVEEALRARLATVQAEGARSAFSLLPHDEQRAYEEVSFAELAAYSAFMCYARGRGASEWIATQAWSSLGSEAQAEWTTECPRDALASDPLFAPYLRDAE